MIIVVGRCVWQTLLSFYLKGSLCNIEAVSFGDLLGPVLVDCSIVGIVLPLADGFGDFGENRFGSASFEGDGFSAGDEVV